MEWLKVVDYCCKASHRTAYKHLIYIYVSFRYLDDTLARICFECLQRKDQVSRSDTLL